MSYIETGLYQIGKIDHLASLDTPIHRIDPRAKVLTTLVFLVCVISFGRFTILPLIPYMVFPIVLAAMGDIPLRYIGSRMLVVAPFAVVVGIFNPVLDRAVIGHIGGLGLTAGWVSFGSIMIRFMLTTSAALLLISTTGMNNVCVAIERLGIPNVITSQLLFLYRYIFVLAEEALAISQARSLRSFKRRGMGLTVFGQIIGHLLLRTFARAQRIYNAMLCRGFDGSIHTLRRLRFARRDWTFLFGWSAVFLAFRAYDIPLMAGRLIMRIS